ncbi:MAG TPA: hypothetical protein VGU61_07780 [Noviherbaspirillum sp.]|jgi:hypothetical protein|uniref:hypothetical protein n=1 Tax=Noviherbaspirillum sp. TaxID=1926288 RepID=UPI002DDCB6EA|nr:hypothetical protein [Noviherbaspirillum sp.]HEV2610152.1 hypothetical protein [Noviherbaspirillum sp.]
MTEQEITIAGPYNPDRLLDTLVEKLDVDNDTELARKLKVARPILEMIRRRELGVSASMLMWMHEASGMAIRDLRTLLGDRRGRYRPLRAGDYAAIVGLRK